MSFSSLASSSQVHNDPRFWAEQLPIPTAPARDGELTTVVGKVIEYLQNYKNIRAAHRCWFGDTSENLDQEFHFEWNRIKLQQGAYEQLQALFSSLCTEGGMAMNIKAFFPAVRPDEAIGQHTAQIIKDMTRGDFCELRVQGYQNWRERYDQAARNIELPKQHYIETAIEEFKTLILQRLDDVLPGRDMLRAREDRLRELLSCLSGCVFAAAKDSLEMFVTDLDIAYCRSESQQDSLQVSVDGEAFQLKGVLAKDLYLSVGHDQRNLGTVFTEVRISLPFDSLWMDWSQPLALQTVPVRHYCQLPLAVDEADLVADNIVVHQPEEGRDRHSWFQRVRDTFSGVVDSVNEMFSRWF